jgi:transposase
MATVAPAARQGGQGCLRREGLYSSLITNWRQQREKGALQALGVEPGRPKADPRDREIARLEAETARPPAARDTERTR